MSDSELCCICFEQVCTIEVKDCGHQMCAQCTLALCCHNKPNLTTSTVNPPVCPFCRSVIARLVVAQNNNKDDRSKSQDEVGDVSSSKLRKHRRSINLGEESSSFMGLSSIGSFGKVTGRGSGRIVADNELMDKPISWGLISLKDKTLWVKLWECIDEFMYCNMIFCGGGGERG